MDILQFLIRVLIVCIFALLFSGTIISVYFDKKLDYESKKFTAFAGILKGHKDEKSE